MKRGMGSAALAVLLMPMAAAAADRPWMDPALLAAAQKEGTTILYSSVNEEEQLPQIKAFEDATQIKVDYIRGSDVTLMARIAVENRAGKQTWDVLEIQAAEGVPKEWRLQFEPPEAAHLMPGAKDPDNRWFGGYTVYHTPAYNTTKIKREELPQSYEDLAKKTAWAGHVGIDGTDREWLAGMFQFYGPDKGRKIVEDLVSGLHPALYKGHLALARALGAGEYWVTLNNFVNLTLNVKMGGAPVDFWILDPVIVTYGEVAANAKAPHLNAAKLLVNYLISAEAQERRTKWGRIPTREDVATNPPGIFDLFRPHHLVRSALTPEEDTKWQKTFNEIFRR